MGTRTTLDLADFTGGNAPALFKHALRKSLAYNIYGKDTTFNVTVLTQPIGINTGDSEAIFGGNLNEEGGTTTIVSGFYFKGRIQDYTDRPSPHAFFPNPCDLAVGTKEQIDFAARVMNQHTTFMSREGWSGVVPKVGDVVSVNLSPGDFTFNLQYAYFDSVVLSKPTGGTGAGQCNSLIAAFGAAGGGAAIGNPKTYGKLKCPGTGAETDRLQKVADKIGVKLPILLAIRKVESGYLGPSAIRFEPHKFVGEHRPDLKKAWLASGWYCPGCPREPDGGPHNAKAPNVDYVDANTNKAGFDRAFGVDPVAAIKSTSWGSFQVMGTSARKSKIAIIKNGVKDESGAKKFVEYFYANPVEASDELLVTWFSSRPDAVQHANNLDWLKLAKRYNGGGCCGPGSRNYDLKFADAYAQALGCT